jgi:hypothetical protein
MDELKTYLQVFYPIIGDLNKDNTNNIKLGGTLVLKLHGLNFSRKVGDLDIIIYNATPKQQDYIKALSNFRVDSNYGSQTNIKIKKHDLFLNILLVDVPIVHENVHYIWNDKIYEIVSISEIIKAKSSYKRLKDVEDLLMLKNENFNL